MDVAAPGLQWDEALKMVQRSEDAFNRGDVTPNRGFSGNSGKGVGGKISSRPVRAAK